MKHIVEVAEISIKVPWGHIAAKWWGSRLTRPIVLIHGWQDNAGTFDALIPLLPRQASYLAIDLPGHGLSSYLPSGMIYSQLNYVYVLRWIYKHYNWDRMSLIGHSMGAIVSFYYACSFPDECDMVLAIDALVPHPTNNSLFLDSFRNGLNDIMIADERNISGTEPPSYPYEIVEKKLLTGVFSSYTKETLPFLLVRGITESKSNQNKYFFTRDNRIKARNIFYAQEREAYVEMASRIKIPYCYIKALQCGFSQWDYIDEILATMKSSNAMFEVHGVDGDHHVHLTDPEKVGPIVSQFLYTHRLAKVSSKL
ncbi:putative serine hydrolase [Pseudolycoriella hygida]|uniref:Serine hydrolase n=1 Tax=Pseudolycoriella hygida TaxID=35572 RepID=A0A9Q0NC16_9DIPT|nr:putative serine hydrolase [Pseudolycoriella hygida]